MAPDHQRYEQLAVGHVLGGLPADDASAFRQHLPACRPCQARVAELRDLASDLAAAERQERAVQRLKTETPTRRASDPPQEDDSRRQLIRLVALAVGLVAVIGMLIWNAHLRGQNEQLMTTTRLREDTLAALGRGAVVPATFEEGTAGVVTADDEAIAYSLSNLPTLTSGQRLVVWTSDDGQLRAVAVHTARQVREGLLASLIADRTADRLLVTIEDAQPAARPSDDVLVDADLAVVR